MSRAWLQFLLEAAANPNSGQFIPNEDRWHEIVESRDEYTSENVFWMLACGQPAKSQ